MLLLVTYVMANLLLAVAAFWVATSRPDLARWVWLLTALFVVGAVGIVYDLVTNPALMHALQPS